MSLTELLFPIAIIKNKSQKAGCDFPASLAKLRGKGMMLCLWQKKIRCRSPRTLGLGIIKEVLTSFVWVTFSELLVQLRICRKSPLREETGPPDLSRSSRDGKPGLACWEATWASRWSQRSSGDWPPPLQGATGAQKAKTWRWCLGKPWDEHQQTK